MPHRVPEEALIIGQNLRDMRKSSGYSQAVLGKFIGVTSQQVQKYESGQNRLPAEKLYHLHTLLNRPLEQFFRGLHHPTPVNDADFYQPVLERLIHFPDREEKRKIIKIVEILLS